MKSLALALYAEGPSDHRFLPIVIQRTCRQLLDQHKQIEVRTLPVKSIVFDKAGLEQAECIVQAACEAVDYDVLIIHTDADHRTSEKALHERYYPGHKLVQRCTDEVCKNLLPIIPVYMTEAWMLADHKALRGVIETDIRAHELGLPRKTRQVELDSDPKQTLKQVLQRAYAYKSRRHRQIDLGFLYEPLAREISLERLNEVPAYHRFKTDLIATLKALNLISLS